MSTFQSEFFNELKLPRAGAYLGERPLRKGSHVGQTSLGNYPPRHGVVLSTTDGRLTIKWDDASEPVTYARAERHRIHRWTGAYPRHRHG
jgi:hypothetical protein